MSQGVSAITHLDNSIVRRPWTKEEDEELCRLVQIHGEVNWTKTAKAMQKYGRSNKSCRFRWHNHLAPVVNKADFSAWEDAVIVKGHQLYGNKWAAIARRLPGRTENSVKNRFNAIQRRQKSGKLPRNRYLEQKLSLEDLEALAPGRSKQKSCGSDGREEPDSGSVPDPGEEGQGESTSSFLGVKSPQGSDQQQPQSSKVNMANGQSIKSALEELLGRIGEDAKKEEVKYEVMKLLNLPGTPDAVPAQALPNEAPVYKTELRSLDLIRELEEEGRGLPGDLPDSPIAKDLLRKTSAIDNLDMEMLSSGVMNMSINMNMEDTSALWGQDVSMTADVLKTMYGVVPCADHATSTGGRSYEIQDLDDTGRPSAKKDALPGRLADTLCKAPPNGKCIGDPGWPKEDVKGDFFQAHPQCQPLPQQSICAPSLAQALQDTGQLVGGPGSRAGDDHSRDPFSPSNRMEGFLGSSGMFQEPSFALDAGVPGLPASGAYKFLPYVEQLAMMRVAESLHTLYQVQSLGEKASYSRAQGMAVPLPNTGPSSVPSACPYGNGQVPVMQQRVGTGPFCIPQLEPSRPVCPPLHRTHLQQVPSVTVAACGLSPSRVVENLSVPIQGPHPAGLLGPHVAPAVGSGLARECPGPGGENQVPLYQQTALDSTQMALNVPQLPAGCTATRALPPQQAWSCSEHLPPSQVELCKNEQVEDVVSRCLSCGALLPPGSQSRFCLGGCPSTIVSGAVTDNMCDSWLGELDFKEGSMSFNDPGNVTVQGWT